MNLAFIGQLLQFVAAGIVFTLHATGADKHKTIAGQVAGWISGAASAAAAADQALRQNPPPTAAQTP